jgi:prepilin-type N-terminal cleavage/methylation domain-containing protein
MESRAEQAKMPTSPAPTLRRIRGFTLLELIIVVALIGIFITFASVNWNIGAKKGKEALLEQFSIDVSVIREEAISKYENRLIEFDVTNSEVRVGRTDLENGFVETDRLRLPEDFRIKDVVINGQAFPEGKCYMTFYPSGMVDRAVLHVQGGPAFYSLLVNPLTAKVTGEDGYIGEISIK